MLSQPLLTFSSRLRTDIRELSPTIVDSSSRVLCDGFEAERKRVLCDDSGRERAWCDNSGEEEVGVVWNHEDERVAQSGGSTSQEKKMMRVSWIPSSSEDESDIGIEAEEELGESQGSAMYLEEWNQPEGRKGYSFQPAFTKQSAGGSWRSSKTIEDLGGVGGRYSIE